MRLGAQDPTLGISHLQYKKQALQSVGPPIYCPFNMALRLRGKVAIVTGASRGIGAQIANELARRGAKVSITYTSRSSEQEAVELVRSINALGNGSSAAAIQIDLRDVTAPSTIVNATLTCFEESHVDILVNNAGCELAKPLSSIIPQDISYVYDLNVRGTLLMTKAVLSSLRAPGRIINISSVGSRSGFAKLSLYCSSKAAIEGLTRCWAAELGSKGHTVNAVNPGPVQTKVLEGIPSEIVDMQKKMTPVENRLGTTDDIAQVVAFLAEENSRWITGQCISASGGYSMY